MVDQSEKIRELLNFSGFPFQHHCADAIAKLDGFQVAVEVPFTDPPTNGPILGVHGSMDILAVHPDKQEDLLVCFIIECKRTKEDAKSWILLPNKQQNPKWPIFMFSHPTQYPVSAEPLSVNRNVAFPELGYNFGRDYDYCVNGIEVNATLTRQNQNQEEKLYKSLRQVAHAAHAFESSSPKVVEGVDYLRSADSYPKRLYIPVVVTTANIYVPQFSSDKVVKGDIAPGDFTLGDPKKWASYELPVPDFMSYSISRGDDGQATIGKRTVFIVNDGSMAEFFSKALNVVASEQAPERTS